MKQLTSKIRIYAAAACLSLLPGLASAVPYYYVDWTSANPAGGVAAGTITPSSGPAVGVTFEAIKADGSAGSFLGAYLSGSGYWNPTSTYISAEVDNAPPGDILQLVGTANMTYKVTLSEAIKDPIMAITSLGSASDSAMYVFDSPFTILSQGSTCCWGGTATSLIQSGNNLLGNEGSGIIQFIGTYDTFSWTVPDPEYWHGFTFGIRTTERLEPTIPEPATLALLGLGALGLGFSHRRKVSRT